LLYGGGRQGNTAKPWSLPVERPHVVREQRFSD
jgi:hypothetical protein